MLLTLTQPVETARGRQGSMVFFPVSGRQFSREFVNPTNPDSAAQAAIRAYTTAASQQYNTLSESQLFAWELYAGNFAQNDRNGNPYSINSKSAFVKVNVWRQMAGQAIVNDPPSYATGSGITSITGIETDGTDTNITWVGPAVAAGQFILVRLTANLGSFARKVRPNDYRVATFPMDESFVARGTGAGGVLTLLNANLRLPPEEGWIMGVQLEPFTANYQAGAKFGGQFEVTAF